MLTVLGILRVAKFYMLFFTHPRSAWEMECVQEPLPGGGVVSDDDGDIDGIDAIERCVFEVGDFEVVIWRIALVDMRLAIGPTE